MSEGKSLMQQASELAHQSLMRSFEASMLDILDMPSGEKFDIPLLPGLEDKPPSITIELVCEGHKYRGIAYLVEEQS